MNDEQEKKMDFQVFEMNFSLPSPVTTLTKWDKEGDAAARFARRQQEREKSRQAAQRMELSLPLDPRGMRSMAAAISLYAQTTVDEGFSQEAVARSNKLLDNLFVSLEDRLYQLQIEEPGWKPPAPLQAFLALPETCRIKHVGSDLIHKPILGLMTGNTVFNMAAVPVFLEWEWKKNHTCRIIPVFQMATRNAFLVMMLQYDDVDGTGYMPAGQADVIQLTFLHGDEINQVHWKHVLESQFSLLEFIDVEEGELDPEQVKFRKALVKYQMLN